MTTDIYGTIGEVFDPTKYGSIEAGWLFSGERKRDYNTPKARRAIRKATEELAVESEYVYDVNNLVENIRKAIEFQRLGAGDRLEVGYGDYTLTARLVIDHEESDPGDGRVTAPSYDCSYRLEEVEITDDDENHRKLDETIIRKIIF